MANKSSVKEGIETLAKSIVHHHRDDLTISRSGKNWLLYGYHPMSWKSLKLVLVFNSSPVSIDPELSQTQMTWGLLKQTVRDLL